MSNQNRIALFVDIDNMPLNKEHIDNLISQLEKSGEIVFAKFYGVTDRRHRDIICDAVARGFESVPPVNPKKRGSIKVFDNRILVDLCEMVFTGVAINTVSIVAYPINHVQLFAKLKLKDIAIYGCDNLDDDSLKFVSKVLDFGYEDPNTAYKLKLASQREKAAQKPKRVVRPIRKVGDVAEEHVHAPAAKAVETITDGKKDPIVIEVPITVNPVLDGELPKGVDNEKLDAIHDELKVIQESARAQAEAQAAAREAKAKEDSADKENPQLTEIREELKALRSHISDVNKSINKSGDNNASIEQLLAIREELKALHGHFDDVDRPSNKEESAELAAIKDELKSLHAYVERVNKPQDKSENAELSAIREELRILHEQAEIAHQADAKFVERLAEIEQSVKDEKAAARARAEAEEARRQAEAEARAEAARKQAEAEAAAKAEAEAKVAAEAKKEKSVLEELRVINEAQKAVNEMKNKPQEIDDPDNKGDDLDILRQIQQMKDDIPSSDDAEDAELIEKIKRLLDEFN